MSNLGPRPTSLSNKQRVVLDLLRELGEMTCKKVGEMIMERTPCGTCGGTGREGDGSCRRCYGRGRAYFGYSDAYLALEQLRRKRLVSRRYLVDEWGDATPRLVYQAVPATASVLNDPLEALFAAPSAEISR